MKKKRLTVVMVNGEVKRIEGHSSASNTTKQVKGYLNILAHLVGRGRKSGRLHPSFWYMYLFSSISETKAVVEVSCANSIDGKVRLCQLYTFWI
jgi:hypothetical protein